MRDHLSHRRTFFPLAICGVVLAASAVRAPSSDGATGSLRTLTKSAVATTTTIKAGAVTTTTTKLAPATTTSTRVQIASATAATTTTSAPGAATSAPPPTLAATPTKTTVKKVAAPPFVYSGRVLAVTDIPDGWTPRAVNAAAGPYDCRHIQPAVDDAVRTERIGFVAPSGRTITQRLDIFSNELTAYRAKDRLVTRLNGCSTALFNDAGTAFRFTRTPVSFLSEPGPTAVQEWKEATFGTSPIGEGENLYVFLNGPSITSLWTSPDVTVDEARALIISATAAGYSVPQCVPVWQSKGLTRCADGRLELAGRRIYGATSKASKEFELYPGRFLASAPRSARSATPLPDEQVRMSASFRSGLTLLVTCRATTCRGDLTPLPAGARATAAKVTAPTSTSAATSTTTVTSTTIPTATTTSTSTTTTTRPTTTTTTSTTTTTTTKPSTTTTSTTTSTTTTSTTTTTTTTTTSTTTSTTSTTTSTTTTTTRPPTTTSTTVV